MGDFLLVERVALNPPPRSLGLPPPPAAWGFSWKRTSRPQRCRGHRTEDGALGKASCCQGLESTEADQGLEPDRLPGWALLQF